LINFNRPHGNYDEISLSCSSQDQHCSNNSEILTNTIKNCSDCTSMSISPITRGVSYKCQAITLKKNFPNITSNELIFNTCMSFKSIDRNFMKSYRIPRN
jgi:hypothetical protein